MDTKPFECLNCPAIITFADETKEQQLVIIAAHAKQCGERAALNLLKDIKGMGEETCYFEKLFFLVKYRGSLNVLPNTELAILERWMDENKAFLIIVPSSPVLIGNIDVQLFNVLLKIENKDNLIISLVLTNSMAGFEQAIKDIRLNTCVMGTKDNNTDGKSVYIGSVDPRSKDLEKL